MELTWHGRARFRLRAGGQTWWLDTGADPSQYEADPASAILDARSSGDVGRVGPGRMPVLDGPGEYEIGGVPVVSVRTSAAGAARDGRRVTFRLAVDGARVGYVGADAALAGSPVAARAITEVAPVDVAIIPVGDGFGLGAAEALALSRSLEARVVVAYAPPGDPNAVESVRRLCREIGSDPDATSRALVMTGASVPAVPRVVVLANRASDAGA